jgi:hypothetical protein
MSKDVIQSLGDLKEYYGLEWDDDERKLQRRAYDETECGVTLDIEPSAVVVWASIEGSDAVTERHRLEYPFTPDAFEEAIRATENEADALWQEENGPYEEDEDPTDRIPVWSNEGNVSMTLLPDAGGVDVVIAVAEDATFTVAVEREEKTKKYHLKVAVEGLSSFEIVGMHDQIEAMLEKAQEGLKIQREIELQHA